MKKAFLSHGWCDVTLVAKFGEYLEQHGIPVFLDKWDIQSGAMVWSRIDKAIDDASKLVLFLSRDALTGKGVREEVDRGLQKAYERNGEVFIIPVALDPIEDIGSLLPIRVRGANMIRAFELGYSESVSTLQLAILDQLPNRIAKAIPTDFYYRIYQFADSMIIELGSGLPVQEGFGFETIWPEPVQFIDGGIGPSGKPSVVPWSQGMWMTTRGFYIPKDAATRLCPAYSNRRIKRGESFYMRVTTPSKQCPQPPTKVRLYDQFYQAVRDPVAHYS